MCEAHVYMMVGEDLNEVMKNVVSITPMNEDKLLLVDLFGEQKTVKAKLKDLQLLNHKVILEASD